MFIITSLGAQFRASVQGDYVNASTCDVFSLSRTMLSLERLDVEKICTYTIVISKGGGGVVSSVKYYSDTSGKLELPLRNIINSNLYETLSVAIGKMDLDDVAFDDTVGFAMDTHIGISYAEALSPKNKDINIDNFPDSLKQSVILPPNVMINPNFTGATYGILVESNYADYDGDAQWDGVVSGLAHSITPIGDRNNMISVLAAYESLRLSTGKNHDLLKEWKFEKPDQCTDLVAIQWTSLTGCLRRHYFPIIGYINSTNKEVSIIEAGNGYDVRKNAYKGIHCRLTGLTPYGCWYYQDMIQASDAHAIVAPSTAYFGDEIASSETACHITGGMDENPSGNGFYTFDFLVKLRHYDTV